MKRYREDDRGRIFRWDGQLEQWHRIMSHDEEYEAAVRSLRDVAADDAPVGDASGAGGPVARTQGSARTPAQRPADRDDQPATAPPASP